MGQANGNACRARPGEPSVKLRRWRAWAWTANNGRVVSRIRDWCLGLEHWGFQIQPYNKYANPRGLQRMYLSTGQVVKCRVRFGPPVEGISVFVV